tara:strand:+ start:383 stop:619 length:237 start_codon:yes stop_codon:yes gene_type:complete
MKIERCKNYMKTREALSYHKGKDGELVRHNLVSGLDNNIHQVVKVILLEGKSAYDLIILSDDGDSYVEHTITIFEKDC